MDDKQALMLLVVTAGAFLVPLISERIGWFTAPCEMLYGTLAVNLLPGVDQPGAFISTLAQFGFLLLLFLAGLEIDFSLLRKRGPRNLLRATGAAAGLQGAALVVGLLLGWPLGWPPIYLLLVGALSISLLLVVLQELRLAQTPFGQSLLVVGAIGEFLTILEVTAFDLVSRNGVSWMLALAVLKLVALFVAGYLALRWLNGSVSRHPGRLGRLLALRDSSELGVRAAIAFMLAFAAVAVLLRVEQILATFIAGAVCNFAFRGHNTVTHKIMTMGQGFFVPVFFISVGMGLRWNELLHPRVLTLIGALLLGLLITRLLAAPALRLAGIPWRQAVPAALLLGAPLTLIVAIAQVGINTGHLSATMHSAVLAVAILSAVLFPLAARTMLSRGSTSVAARPRPLRAPVLPARTRFALSALRGSRPAQPPHPERVAS